jgi:hypothetical protein
MITKITKKFEEIENRDSIPWMEELKLSVRSKNGVQVAMKPV